jgi:hypothetical protein
MKRKEPRLRRYRTFSCFSPAYILGGRSPSRSQRPGRHVNATFVGFGFGSQPTPGASGDNVYISRPEGHPFAADLPKAASSEPRRTYCNMSTTLIPFLEKDSLRGLLGHAGVVCLHRRADASETADLGPGNSPDPEPDLSLLRIGIRVRSHR